MLVAITGKVSSFYIVHHCDEVINFNVKKKIIDVSASLNEASCLHLGYMYTCMTLASFEMEYIYMKRKIVEIYRKLR